MSETERVRKWLVLLFLVMGAGPGIRDGYGENETGRPGPGQLEIAGLEGMEALEDGRRRLIEVGLEQAKTLGLDEYVFGSADPNKGGFDCSGAVYYLLKTAQVAAESPPRSSSAQYDWVKKQGNLVEVPATVESLDDAIFDSLKPGDLLFWAGTYQPTDGRTNGVTHVQIYLGKEKADGRHVMLGSSDGRSYQGTARCGFGVFDFRLPRKGSKARLVGYGGVKVKG